MVPEKVGPRSGSGALSAARDTPTARQNEHKKLTNLMTRSRRILRGKCSESEQFSLWQNRISWHYVHVVESKLTALRELIRSYGSCIVAYSGGVDSAFLASVAHQVLGEKALAVIADSPSLPRRELEEALQVAKQFGFPVRVIQTKEFDNSQYLANPNNRCYFCKHELFSELTPLARTEGFSVIA